MLAGEGLTLLDGDPLWPVLSEDMPDEDRLDNHEEAYAGTWKRCARSAPTGPSW